MDSQIYKILDPDPKPIDHYSNLIFEKTGLLPAQCYKINDNKDIFIKFIKGANEKLILGADNIKKFKEIGLGVKLSADQIDKNTIFINSAPITILETDPDILLDELNRDNPNMVALSIYAPPTKSLHQKLTTIKITLASRIMANSCYKFGVKIKGCLIPSSNIKQGQYLKTPQCPNCNGFHPKNSCTKEHPICAHCGGNHKKFSCSSINSRPFCANCRGPHRATSNRCPIRREYLSEEFIGDTRESDLTCPFTLPNEKESFVPAPAPSTNIWEQPQNGSQQNTPTPPPQQSMGQSEAPLTTYNDCLKMALNFKQWYQSFLVLQSLMGLKKIELPDSLRKNINIEPNNNTETIFLDPSNNTFQNQNQSNPSPTGPQPEIIPFYLPQRSNPQANLTRTPKNISYYSQPLTGANLVPLPQRNQPQRRALLPTPTDQFSQVSKNSGAIPKPKPPPPIKQNIPPIRTQNFFEPLADPDLAPTGEHPYLFSTDDGWDFARESINKNSKSQSNARQKPESKNSKEQAEAKDSPSNSSKDVQSIKSTTSQSNQNIISDSHSNQTNPITQKDPTPTSTTGTAPTHQSKTLSNPVKPPIKIKPNLAKYRPTQEIPSFLKNKLPSNRHSMDPKQFKSTIQSFEALSNAALKKAEQEYRTTKEDFLMNTSLPEFQNFNTDHTQEIPNTQVNTHNPSPNEGTISNSSNTTYTLGTTKTPDKSIHTRKQYKHPTPSPQNSDTDQEEIDIVAPITHENEDSDTLPDLTNSPNKHNKKRMLRSNSRQNNYPSCQ